MLTPMKNYIYNATSPSEPLRLNLLCLLGKQAKKGIFTEHFKLFSVVAEALDRHCKIKQTIKQI